MNLTIAKRALFSEERRSALLTRSTNASVLLPQCSFHLIEDVSLLFRK